MVAAPVLGASAERSARCHPAQLPAATIVARSVAARHHGRGLSRATRESVAPAAGDGIESMVDFLGGQEAYERLRLQAKKSGDVVFETRWGARQHLSLKWFTDMESSEPQTAIGGYEGALLVLYGSDDETVAPRFGKAVVASATRSSPLVEHIVEGGSHGLGFYDDNAEMATEVVSRTTRFLKDNL